MKQQEQNPAQAGDKLRFGILNAPEMVSDEDDENEDEEPAEEITAGVKDIPHATKMIVYVGSPDDVFTNGNMFYSYAGVQQLQEVCRFAPVPEVEASRSRIIPGSVHS